MLIGYGRNMVDLAYSLKQDHELSQINKLLKKSNIFRRICNGLIFGLFSVLVFNFRSANAFSSSSSSNYPVSFAHPIIFLRKLRRKIIGF